MKNKEAQELINNAEEELIKEGINEEAVEVKEDGKIKKALKVIWKYAKKAAPAVVAGVGGFALGRLTKGAIDELPIPEEAVEAVTTAAEAVSE